MTLEIIVEDVLINTKLRSASDEYSGLIQLQNSSIIQKWGLLKNDSPKIGDMINKASLGFAATYNAVKQKINEDKVFNVHIPEDFKREFYVYCGADAVIQALDRNSSSTMQKVREYDKPAPDMNIDYKTRDYITISEIIQNLSKYITDYAQIDDLGSYVKSYFKYVQENAFNMLTMPGTNNYQDCVKKLKIIGKGFEINGLKKRSSNDTSKTKEEKQSSEEDIFSVDLKEIKPQRPLEKNDIFGNDDALTCVENSVASLLAYDTKKRLNPYLLDGGFNQLILLVGDSGTGKTMIMEYAVSLADKISKENKIDFLPVKMDFSSHFQDGPIKILKYQLSSITNDNRPYIVFLDEMEGKFPSRTDENSLRFEQKLITEFLDFTNGLSYNNKGNYVIIGATNLAENIDKAIKSRFKRGTFVCNGPRTKEEKAKVLYNNLVPGINGGYVKINNLADIAEEAVKAGLSGRGLMQCANDVLEKSRVNHYPKNFYSFSFEDKLSVIKSHHRVVDDTVIMDALHEIAKKDDCIFSASLQYRGS